MKKFTLLFVFFGLFSLSGCATSHDESKNQPKDTTSYENHSSTSHTDSGSSPIESTTSSISTSTTDNTETKISTNQSLTTYTDDQIEYARIWLQLGANQEIDTLYIQRIPAGTSIVPSISNSAVFPEDVIQLSGGRKIDGSVTYGSNHNGTIHLYDVPTNLYWEFTSAGTPEATLQDESQKVLTTKLVSVDTGDTSQVIKLINLEKYTGDIDLSRIKNQ